MPTYEVTFESLIEYVVDVEADNEHEATEIALFERDQGVTQVEEPVHSTVIKVREHE